MLTCEAASEAASNFWRTRVSISCATAMKSRRLPVSGSNSISSALTIAPEKSLATSRPTMPALRMLRRTASRPSRRRLEVVGDDVAGGDAVLDHFGVAHVGREQRLHPAAVDPGQEEDLVGHVLQHLEELRREHVAVSGHHRHQHPVGAAELLLVLKERRHVRVLERQQLGEAGVDAQARGRPAEQSRRQDEETDHHGAVAEDQLFEAVAERWASPSAGQLQVTDAAFAEEQQAVSGVGARGRRWPGDRAAARCGRARPTLSPQTSVPSIPATTNAAPGRISRAAQQRRLGARSRSASSSFRDRPRRTGGRAARTRARGLRRAAAVPKNDPS